MGEQGPAVWGGRPRGAGREPLGAGEKWGRLVLPGGKASVSPTVLAADYLQ